MKRVFGVEKFKGLLLASTFAAFANFALSFADTILAGNLIGSDALAGVNLASPFISAATFFACLVSVGVGTVYSSAMGRCDKERAQQFFMQGLWTILVLGGSFMLAAILGRNIFIDFFRPSPEIAVHARAYFTWISPLAVLEGLVFLLLTMAYADGDGRIAVAANAVLLLGNVALSILGIRLGYGAAGCAMGTVIAQLLTLGVLSLHFLRKSNTVRFVRHYSFKDTLRIFEASFGDAAAFLCQSLLFFFLNAFVARLFGPYLLPVVGIITILWGVLMIFDGIGNALQPIVTVYYAEGNYPSVRTVMRAAAYWSLLEGVVAEAIAVSFAPTIVRLVGIDDPTLVPIAVSAARWASLGFIFMPFAGLFNSYYMFVDRPYLAGSVTFLAYLVMPIALSAVGAVLGTYGLWVGLGLGAVAGLLSAFAVIRPLVGKGAFPLLLPQIREGDIQVFNLALCDQEISEVSRKVAALPGVPMKAALMVEEVFEVVKERNNGRRILGEVTVDLTDGVKLTLRDDGEIFDITDADARISSLRGFLVASIMEHHAGKLNLITTGFNRNVFRF